MRGPGCTALLVTGFGVRDSVTSIADKQYDEIQTYQLNITLDDEAGERDTLRQEIYGVLDALGGKYTCAYEASLDLQTPQGPKSVNLIVAENPSDFGAYINLHTPSGDAIPYPGPGDIVLCDKLAGKYRIKTGDSLGLRSQDGSELSAVLSGVCENYIFNYAYVERQTYEEALGPLTFKNLYVNLPQETDAHEISAALMNLDHVASVQVNEDMLVRFSSMMSSMNYIVFVVIGCAAALAFIVLYNLNNINITERVRELSLIHI